MAAITSASPNSLPEYLATVEKLLKNATNGLWFRGCGSSKHQLVPTLYRHEKIRLAEQLSELERQLLVRFRQRSVPYQSRPLTDDLETLFIMQHYGVPTRLLDWTENPLIALHFALMSAERGRMRSGKAAFDADAVVWLLDPSAWNKHALRNISFDGGVLTPDDDAFKAYRPAPKFAGMHNQPVALYGAHNSARIVAQQGVFMIFGKEIKPMEVVFGQEKYPSKSLTRVVIKKSLISPLREALLKHGFTESMIFPDLEGLAREIKRVFGFGG